MNYWTPNELGFLNTINRQADRRPLIGYLGVVLGHGRVWDPGVDGDEISRRCGEIYAKLPTDEQAAVNSIAAEMPRLHRQIAAMNERVAQLERRVMGVAA